MKIICDSCSARYSIADDKIAGRVFKIRCKKCSEVIVVRGDQLGRQHAKAAAPSVDERPDAIWHVVISGDQKGPYASSQICEMLATKALDPDVYVWREGFEDWRAASDVPELAPSRNDHDGRLGGTDIFAKSHEGPSPFEGGGSEPDVHASSPSPVVGDPAMSGQRNENSVLFSLQNLRALATGSASASPEPTPAATSSNAQTGHATGEASGLIDIRALASSAGVVGAADVKAADEESVDDLLRIGAGSPLTRGLGGPVLAPVVEEKRDRNLLIAVAAVGSIVALAAAAIIGVLLTGPAHVAAAPHPSAGAGPIAPGADTLPTREMSTNTAAEPTSPEVITTTPSPEEAVEERDGAADETERRRGNTPRERRRPPREANDAVPETTPTGPRSIEELLNLGAPMEARNTLPDTPARESVGGALRSVRGAVSRCGDGQHGTADTTITVTGTNGRVGNVRVTGQFAGTRVGSCVARAVRGARFPRFRQRTFEVSFPYRI